jgi:hypothetical protein
VRTIVAALISAVTFAAAPCLAAQPAPKPAAAPAKGDSYTTKETRHFVVKSNLPAPFPAAISDICEATLDGYRDRFGLYLYPNPYPGDKRMVVWAVQKPGKASVSLETQVKPMELHISVPSDAALNPPADGGEHHLFAIAREFGRLPIAFNNDSFNAGVAAYLGSEVVNYVATRLGEKAWPRPYSYIGDDGTGRLRSWQYTAEPASPESAASLLDELARAHGRETLGKAFRLLTRSTQPKPYKVAALCRLLVDMTGDGEIAEMFKSHRFPSVLDPVDITASELWEADDEPTRCKLICDRWGTNADGLLDGLPVTLLLRATEERRPAPVRTPDGLTLSPVREAWAMAWYQPATKRTYISGKVLVSPTGVVVEDTILGPDGEVAADAIPIEGEVISPAPQ